MNGLVWPCLNLQAFIFNCILIGVTWVMSYFILFMEAVPESNTSVHGHIVEQNNKNQKALIDIE